MNEINRCKPLLGTYVEVSLTADASDMELISLSNSMFERIANIQKQMSFHDNESTLSQINRQANNSPIKLSDDYIELFSIISDLNRYSDGYFDPSIAPSLMKADVLPHLDCEGNCARKVSAISTQELGSWQDLSLSDNQLTKRKPLMIDLGGIAKGYAVDKAIELVPSEVEACVNAGGDLRFTHWQEQTVGIKHGQAANDTAEIATSAMNMLAPAVATTSAYYQEGVSHIVNPKDGVLQDDVRTYSVFAPSCVLADGLTKLACLMYSDCNAKLNEILSLYSARLIVSD